MRQRLPAAILTMLLVALLVSPALATDGVKPPRRPLVGSHGLFVRAQLGSYCVTREAGGTSVGMCADATPPSEPPKARLPLEPGDRIAIHFRHRRGLRDRPRHVQISLGRIHAGKLQTLSVHIKAHRVRGHPRQWRGRAPQQTSRANVLELFARFRSGDAESLAGLKRR